MLINIPLRNCFKSPWIRKNENLNTDYSLSKNISWTKLDKEGCSNFLNWAQNILSISCCQISHSLQPIPTVNHKDNILHSIQQGAGIADEWIKKSIGSTSLSKYQSLELIIFKPSSITTASTEWGEQKANQAKEIHFWFSLFPHKLFTSEKRDDYRSCGETAVLCFVYPGPKKSASFPVVPTTG